MDMAHDTLPLLPEDPLPARETLAPGAVLLRGFALPVAAALFAAVGRISAESPFRNFVTPGGKAMSVAMTNCGPLGWCSDRRGYRYAAIDPMTGRPWPALPTVFRELARAAAAAAGFAAYAPDVCLINRYEIGTRLTLHRDQDERDHRAPIVSVSLGLPATFLWGGPARRDPQRRVPLAHGDVVAWGGPARMRYHGVLPIRDGDHALTGRRRFNLTFRVAR